MLFLKKHTVVGYGTSTSSKNRLQKIEAKNWGQKINMGIADILSKNCENIM